MNVRRGQWTRGPARYRVRVEAAGPTPVAGARRDTQPGSVACVFFSVIALLVPCHAVAGRIFDIEYAIVSAALGHGLGTDVKSVVIDALTTGLAVNLADPARPETDVAEETGTTVRALREWTRVNRERHELTASFSINATFALLSPAERAEIFTAEDPPANWARFRQHFADAVGILRVSRPGIDEVAGVALVYVEFECGPECASGRLLNVVLDETGTWRVASGSLVWITAPD